jgi:dTDP-4-dehydrorhamnose reductase
MKVLITGAGGQLGTDLAGTMPDGISLFSLTRRDLDITDGNRAASLLREISPDVVINTAGYVGVDDAEIATARAFEINAVGAKNLADACREVEAVLVHISTDYVFDGENAPEPYHEDHAPNPLNVYGVSKYAGELFVGNRLERYYIVRTASLYGRAGARVKGGNFVYTVLDRVKRRETMRVADDIRMSPTFCIDLAGSIWNLIREGPPYGTYHMTNSGHCSWYEFAGRITEIAKLPGRIIPVPHTHCARRARVPVWSPLASRKGIRLRAWERALEAFLGMLEPV